MGLILSLYHILLRTLIIASTSSGPVPSPRIIAAISLSFEINSRGKIISIYVYLGVNSNLTTRLLVNGGIFDGISTAVNPFFREVRILNIIVF